MRQLGRTALRAAAVAGLVTCTGIELMKDPVPLAEERMGTSTSEALKTDMMCLAGGLMSAAVLVLTESDRKQRQKK